MTTTTYYNAKPTNISNIGEDLAGAKRHHFDTYENPEQKKKRQETNKKLKQVKEEGSKNDLPDLCTELESIINRALI